MMTPSGTQIREANMLTPFHKFTVLAAIGLTFGLLACQTQAGGLEDTFRKVTGTDKTKVKDGDADMGLPQYHGIKHAVGVVDFQNDAGYNSQWKLGYNLSILLESALFDTGRFVLVEREKLGMVMGEQDLAASGRMAKASSVAQTGKLRPAKYIATGALTEVEENESGGGGGFNIKGIRVGGSKADAKLTIIAKLIDTTTGEIVAKKRITGEAGRAKLNFGLTKGSFKGDIGGFAKTPLGEAAQDCINQAAKFFALQMEELPAGGAVVMVKDGRVIINRGEQYNFREGMVLAMTEMGEDLIDPETGEVLEKAEGQEIGTIRITKTSKKVSYCELIQGEPNPPRGTVVSVISVPFNPEEDDADSH
jgi:curli biogenesis system outer membrane secretion channel CsgG